MVTILAMSLVSIPAVLLSTDVFQIYGLALFAAMPFAIGLVATLLYSFHEYRKFSECISVSVLTVLISFIALIIFAIEGLVCLVMAFPFAIVFAILGAFIGYKIQCKSSISSGKSKFILLILFFVPLIMGMEYAFDPQPKLISVKSYVDIEASTEKVWQNVLAFPALPEPNRFLFKIGIAYPTHAEIEGKGVGALRECHFSTGAFIEPITIWEENKLLRFDVVEQPDPMRELSPYKNIHPTHLDGFMKSKQGQFLLTKLPDGKIRLEGTTWYTNKMWPQMYWNAWSDYIIHQIHVRVLEHIKNISEI